MAKLFGVDIAGILHKSLSPGLLPGTLYVENTTARDPLDPTAGPVHGEPLRYTFRGAITSYTDKEIDGNLIKKEDRKVLIIAKSISNQSIVPANGMKVSVTGTPGLWRIERVRMDPATATYTCQARK
jgi:hypothetical protein